ncbi:aspartate/glutamate racemase family protein [Mediterraneibacter sp. ICN-202921]|uniref:aspartate/glutamate racemase family protein n=1 Tax=Mediterraneibacter sp. ICN-202921 TaxID=3134657 RepID=UPI0030BD82F2
MEKRKNDRIAYGGYNVYGFDIGILMLDSKFPRIEGDVGNAKTWQYPVLYKKVPGGTPQKVVLELTEEDVQPFIKSAIELEQEGVKAITTSCGFLALFQETLASAVHIPVFTSALLLVPFVSNLLGKGQKVGILTANKKTLSDRHLESAKVDKSKCVIIGLEEKENFTNFTVQNWDKVDVELCREELCEAAQELMDTGEDLGAVVLECTNMPPFSEDIQRITQLPVFDIVTLTNMVQSAWNPQRFLR